MKEEDFVETQNFITIWECFARLKELPIDSPRMGIAFGNFGLGKTVALEKIAAYEHAILLRTEQTWTKASLLRKLCFEMDAIPNTETTINSSFLQSRLVEALLVDPRPIIIDEIDTLLKSDKTPVLELLRDIHDMTGCVIFFVGMEEANAKLKRFSHYYSRIVEVVKFKPIGEQDVKKFCEKSSIVIEDDLVTFFVKRYPNLRQIKVLLIRLEKICTINGIQKVNLEVFKSCGVEHGIEVQKNS
jgi:DNA transposition AAA+ family ATPase